MAPNAEIAQKDHLWMDTSQAIVSGPRWIPMTLP